ncbi:Trk family potassium uptake protein [Heliobacterium gestii]|uniref:Trk family potassium uptake protein n=1 Tax=Heliomicrobium gestii TaxID=2699 RepID=A0A845L705_HELGE|nr:TrkH family potassium uptake protein [Heliomicrobium gestii]MBM7866207.1 trk system potassium uptake protein TrkH [Heliomicrobium gestii]MZP42467.1 Trk family potassium uptake protein [Heliomicrobium gestii]
MHRYEPPRPIFAPYVQGKRPNYGLSPARVLVAGFALIILIGGFLLSTPMASRSGLGTRFLDALFTATSAVCVTGLVVVDTHDNFSLVGQLIIITLIQVGGLGFMTMATLIYLLMGKRINLKERLLMQEALNSLSVQGVVRLARHVLLTTFLIEGIGGVVLSLRFIPQMGLGKGLYYGFFHSISAFCNAGFDLFGGFRGITGYVDDPIVNLTISSLIIFGGLGFTVIAETFRYREIRRFSLHTKLVWTMTIALIIVGAVAIFFLEFNNPKTLGVLGWDGKLLAAYFQSVTPRTAGYNTVSIADLKPATQFLMVILMFIGASPGSTGGGIKTTTLAALLAAVWSMRQGKIDVGFYERRIPPDTIYKAIGITVMAVLLVITVTMLLTITEDADFLALLFEATSAFGTVGLTMGVTSHLSDFGRVLIALTMFAGRVGPLTLAIALSGNVLAKLRYPEEKIMVG